MQICGILMVMETNDCTFTLLTEQNILSLEPYFLQYAYGICDNTIGAVYQWRNIYVSYFAVVDHCLCIRANYGEYGDCYTVPIGCGDFDRAFDCIECDAEKNHIPLRFCVVPEEALGVLRDRYGERVRAESIRDWADYLYDANAFRTYSGKQLHTQKNHVNRFWREHPNAVCAIVNTPEIEQTAQAFLDEYVAQHPDSPLLEQNELRGARELLHNRERLVQTAACLIDGGQALALSVGEVKGDTLYVHVEKARLDVAGAYPAMAQAFVKCFPNVNTVNREDDGGDAGLRYSKLQYKPMELIEKYLVTIQPF